MNIVIVSHSTRQGGAAVVTSRLQQALQQAGHTVTMLETADKPTGIGTVRLGNALTRKLKFLVERLGIFLANGFNRRDLFKVSTATTGFDISRMKQVRQADAVILGWVNQGVLSLKDIARLARLKPTVWIMHDMWCMTGVCHHALACEHYRHDCGNCPFIKHGKDAGDLSRRVHRRKRRLYDATRGNLRFVAVSNWLAGKSRESSLLGDRDVAVIHNVFPQQYLYDPRRDGNNIALQNHDPKVGQDPQGAHDPQGGQELAKRIVMCAARLDDPIKNLPLAVEALNRLSDHYPGAVEAVFVGNLRDPHALDALNIPHEHKGAVSDPDEIYRTYLHSDVVLSTSLFETLPGTIIEGMAAGCMAVATDHGGQRDIIADGIDGYLTGDDPADVARALARVLTTPRPRQEQAASIERRFSATAIVAALTPLLT